MVISMLSDRRCSRYSLEFSANGCFGNSAICTVYWCDQSAFCEHKELRVNRLFGMAKLNFRAVRMPSGDNHKEALQCFGMPVAYRTASTLCSSDITTFV